MGRDWQGKWAQSAEVITFCTPAEGIGVPEVQNPVLGVMGQSPLGFWVDSAVVVTAKPNPGARN